MVRSDTDGRNYSDPANWAHAAPGECTPRCCLLGSSAAPHDAESQHAHAIDEADPIGVREMGAQEVSTRRPSLVRSFRAVQRLVTRRRRQSHASARGHSGAIPTVRVDPAMSGDGR